MWRTRCRRQHLQRRRCRAIESRLSVEKKSKLLITYFLRELIRVTRDHSSVIFTTFNNILCLLLIYLIIHHEKKERKTDTKHRKSKLQNWINIINKSRNIFNDRFIDLSIYLENSMEIFFSFSIKDIYLYIIII